MKRNFATLPLVAQHRSKGDENETLMNLHTFMRTTKRDEPQRSEARLPSAGGRTSGKLIEAEMVSHLDACPGHTGPELRAVPATRRSWLSAGYGFGLLLASVGLATALFAIPAPTLKAPAVDGFLTFRLRLNSLQPPTVTIPEGRYVVRVINGLVIGDITVQIEDAQKTRLADKQVRKQAPKFTAFTDLMQGTYTVRVLGKPQWSSTIIVTKKNQK
jgi:hypothetical protein